MSFKWNVQPYQLKKDIVNEYANAVIVATRKTALKEVKGMEDWMKQNAPWTDRTEEEREKAGVPESGVPARVGLYAYVDDFSDSEHQEARKAYIKEAETRADAVRQGRLLEALEAKKRKISAGYEPDFDKALESWRKQGLDIEQQIGLRETQASAIRNLDKVTLTQGEMNKVKRPRVDKSGLKDIDAQFRGQRLPIVALKAGYSKNTSYAVWLEIANGGRYSILDRAMQKYADRLFNQVISIANLKQFRDKIAFGDVLTSEQRFEKHAAAYEARTGRAYEPWQSTRKKRREGRRRDYDQFLQTEEAVYGVVPKAIGHRKITKSRNRK